MWDQLQRRLDSSAYRLIFYGLDSLIFYGNIDRAHGTGLLPFSDIDFISRVMIEHRESILSSRLHRGAPCQCADPGVLHIIDEVDCALSSRHRVGFTTGTDFSDPAVVPDDHIVNVVGCHDISLVSLPIELPAVKVGVFDAQIILHAIFDLDIDVLAVGVRRHVDLTVYTKLFDRIRWWTNNFVDHRYNAR